MRVLLVSTYDLGRQPYGLASPAAWLRAAGVDVDCVDTSRDTLDDALAASADIVAFYLPMHTATRLAGPAIDRVRRINPAARMAAYGLYAPLNAGWLRERGVTHVLGPEAEGELVELATSRLTASNSPSQESAARSLPRLTYIAPDRTSLPVLSRYAMLQMPDGTRRVVGNTDATRGCKHLCRHCPVVPVYRGTFRAVPLDVVMADIAQQVAGGAQHISFGDPDFFNGPTHARRLVTRLAAEHPGVTYDVTIKIEHLLAHAEMLPLLRETGCLFVTSAVESVDDAVLERLLKGHTRADFVRAVALCRDAGVTLSPTFVAFTPWTPIDGYLELLDTIAALDLVEHVSPIQLAIRLLIPAQSALLDLPEVVAMVDPFDSTSLTWPWRHADPRVDVLQQQVMALVGARAGVPRAEVFAETATLARKLRGLSVEIPGSDPSHTRHRPSTIARDALSAVEGRGQTPPYLTEAWYCCAEPGPELVGEL